MKCGEGARQSTKTCWLYSILNGFLLSEAGQKILYSNMIKFYKKLTPEQKSYFDDRIDAPCPIKGNILLTKKIYFWKFLDQYLCFQSGPRSGSLKSGKSPNVILTNTSKVPYKELPKILDHLDIDQKSMLIMYGTGNGLPYVLESPSGYSLMCSSISLKSLTHGAGHAITGYVCNDKGFIFDSNRTRSHRCDWWNKQKLEICVEKYISPHYNSLRAGFQVYYGFVIYSKNSFVNSVNPVCKLRYNRPRLKSVSPKKNNVNVFSTYWKSLTNSQKNTIRKYINGLPTNQPNYEKVFDKYWKSLHPTQQNSILNYLNKS